MINPSPLQPLATRVSSLFRSNLAPLIVLIVLAFMSTSAFAVPEMDVSGNGNSITDGDATPSATDDTDFGSVAVAGGTNSNTFTITNSGDTVLSLTNTPRVTIGGANAADFTLTTDAATTVASGGGTTTFVITFDPSAAGVRTATVSIANDDGDENPYNFSIQGTGTVAPEIDVQRPASTSIADGGTDTQTGAEAGTQVTLTYTVENTGNAVLNVTNITSANTINATVDSIPTTSFNVGIGATATFTVLYTPTASGAFSFELDITNDDADEGNYDITVSGNSGLNEAETAQTTQRAIHNFMGTRMRNISSQGPGISGFLDGDGMGGSFNGFGNSPVDFNFSGDLGRHQGYISTSLQQIKNGISESNTLKPNSALSAGHALPNGTKNSSHSPVNIWIKGRWTHSKEDRSDIDEKSDFAIFYLGTDYLLSPDLLVGLMGQFDWSDEKSNSLGVEAKGKGWMLGPYMVTRLSDNVILDLRGAWGQSDNEVNPLGTYWDDFDTERWQVEGNLTGNYQLDNWNIKPAVGLSYFEETQKAYTDNNGFRIGKQTLELGSLSFGPTVTYTIKGADGSYIKPLAGLKGIWDFDSPDIYDANGISRGTEDLRAQVKIGLDICMSNGTSIRGSYTYDGIGTSDFESHTGELSMVMPLKLRGIPDGATLQASYFQNGLDLSDNSDNSAKLSVKIPLD